MTDQGSSRKWWTLAAMCFALFMIMLDNTIVNVALPTIQRELHASPSSLEWTVNAYVLSFAALILFGGKLGDRFGRKRIFIVGLIIFTACSALCALATSDTQLITARALQGVGSALLNPLSLSILVAAFPRKQLPVAIGIWAGVSGLGIAIGPVVGGILVEHYGWASVFWVNVPVGIVATIVCILVVSESRDPRTTEMDIVGTVIVTAGLFCLTFGLVKTNDHSWTSPLVLGLLGAAAVLLVAWYFWESHVTQPMVPLSFFSSRPFTVSNIVAMLVGVSLFGSLYFVTLYFQNVKGYSAIEAGLRSMPMTLMIMFIAPIAGRLNTKIGPRPLMAGGMLLSSIGMVTLAQLGVGTSYNQIWPAFVVLGAGLSLTMPSMSSAAMGAVDPTKAGIASGVLNSSRQVGGAIGIAVMGSVVATIAGRQWADHIAALPAPLHSQAARLEQLVVGAQGRLIAQVAGPQARVAALDSFTSGMQAAMYAGAALTFIAFVLSAVAMPRMQPTSTTQAAPAPLEI
jgi:EmrB/QacA subfamily drug resistance transporter